MILDFPPSTFAYAYSAIIPYYCDSMGERDGSGMRREEGKGEEEYLDLQNYITENNKNNARASLVTKALLVTI